ncbi:MAG: class I SAM-dependent methyltransferase [Magnetococcales bacterium]|nr:class I SAM-dependent methyltransferase [Magnetococcales bacterium]MBF0150667.1 class I SAM-dependent methyltransferase [Magnetococcales bacterium]MBF0173431.1 class I SAM-dependent methyltransferase [Magnetococcales bacterium]MBF0346337.1 class I SAM-dependent methyltransferase [Magnetococcales bacterium]MBF0631640.1 class I SAM-dependent methyltransferase [Magnetococcales bacterium]
MGAGGNVYNESFQLTFLEREAVRQRVSKVMTVLERIARTRPDARVLELGCGFRGTNLTFIKRRFPEMQCFGMDLRVDGASTEGIDLFEADLNRWQPEDQWDFVFSLAVVEHLPDPGAHFRLIRDCLCHGGQSVLTTPTPLSFPVLMALSALRIFDARTILDHKFYLTREGIEFFARNTGLSVVHLSSFQWGMNQYAVLQRPMEGLSV